MNAHITNEPARARTDVPAPGAPTTRPTPISADVVRRLGLGLTAGALSWAAATFVFGPAGVGVGGRIGDLTGLLFQLGVFCLLWVQFRTRALGSSRAVSVALTIEAVVLGLAGVWSLLHGVLPDGVQDDTWLAVLDICWPLSMLGMFAISVKLAFAGRWRGLARWWPLVAESWALVTVPSFVLFGEGLSRWVGGGHLLIGYAALGLLLATRPELVLPSQRS